ncbi:uncharacterized protein DUF1524 [Homoserinimonas aerilata]|uniref:Uncharacterized protein DUF1524 n=1 Tax=Homoserinimonas aerilata TaxID=1162970 RepID=A0A542YJH0_9MICO|nr:DUF262 domain-containing protein [Homoserinimonas aerilata]TQL48212.1 uncharacterized protein DUF1524 [Homoserinimonas aerilata]
MDNATNVDATAVNTIRWLSAPETTIVVPVYQRQYRWDIGGCEQLLADIRAAADGSAGHTHFLGSILSTSNSGDDRSDELILIDGQQRITTIMLLVAALRHTVEEADPQLADEFSRVLVSASEPSRTKLRPHREWAQVFESVILESRNAGQPLRESRFDDNYAFFRSQIPLDEVPRIWRGLGRLEHVSITLGAEANAQQTFESLNSTGQPLRDHELIHNYVLMGLTHAEQSEIEDEFWLPIERNTGETIGAFWRHYMVMTTGREIDVADGRGVYDTFRHRFPRLDVALLREHAAEWREFSEVYRTLLEPNLEPDAEIARELDGINVFGRGIYPLVMRGYHDYTQGATERHTLLAGLRSIQSLLLRRTVVGLPIDRIVARLCRARTLGREQLATAIARITPSDDRVRVALKYGALPHPGYVLGRLAGVDDVDTFDVDHILPLAPGAAWTGDGEREWADFSEDEQNSHRALAGTLGNLVLLEQNLAESAFDASFAVKRDTAYARSGIDLTRELADTEAWSTVSISARTDLLTAQFLRVWARDTAADIDDDGLTPILDAKRRRGWPRGWEREFDYVEYRGEHWEVKDVRHLFNRIFKRLWADGRIHVETFSSRNGGPIFEAHSWNGHWDSLDEEHFLYMGWDSRYMLAAVQGLLEEAGIASEVFVKYSYIGDVM